MNERPDWSTEKTLLSIRDIGRLVLSEVMGWIDRKETEMCDRLNVDEDDR